MKIIDRLLPSKRNKCAFDDELQSRLRTLASHASVSANKKCIHGPPAVEIRAGTHKGDSQHRSNVIQALH